MKTRRPLILCYHAISSTWNSSLAVPLDRLQQQLERYAERGYVGLTLAESERRRSAGTLPPKSLVVTFDDAYRSVAQARGILRDLGYPASIFVVGDFLAGDRPLAWPGIDHWADTPYGDELQPLSLSELRELHDEGWEIGSHTMTHPSLPSLDDDDCLRELAASRDLLSGHFGGCDTIAYPYGRVDARVAALAESVGYEAGCSLTYSHVVDDRMRRPRIAVSGTDRPVREWAKMAPLPVRLRRTPLAQLLSRL